jgi:hypothetical protein
MVLPELERLRRDLPADLCEAIDAAVAPAVRDRPTLGQLRTALIGARDEVDDVPGVVEGSTLDEITNRWTAVQRRYRDPGESGWLRRAREGLTRAGAADWEAVDEDERAWASGALGGGEAPAGAAAAEGELAPAPARRLLARAMGAATAAPLAAVALAQLGPTPPLRPVVGAAIAAGLVALLPRVGWLLAAWAIEVWLLAGGHSGTALVLAVAILPVAALLPFAGTLWSWPGAAPALGALGLAGAFPALAGQASTVVRRAALGALGLLWLELAEVLTGTRLLAGPAAGTAARASWDGSAARALDHAIAPLLSSGLLAVAALWALAAAVLPWVVRGRSAALDLAAASAWAAALAVATQAMLDAVSAPSGAPTARGLVVGSVAAALGAVALRAGRRAARPSGPRLP